MLDVTHLQKRYGTITAVEVSFTPQRGAGRLEPIEPACQEAQSPAASVQFAGERFTDTR